jgi:hypothetical protein
MDTKAILKSQMPTVYGVKLTPWARGAASLKLTAGEISGV